MQLPFTLHHITVLVLFLSLIMYIVALVKKDYDMHKTALAMFIGVGLYAFLVISIQAIVNCGMPEMTSGVPQVVMKNTGKEFNPTLIATIIIGVLALIDLCLFRKMTIPRRWPAVPILVFSILTIILALWADDLTGYLRRIKASGKSRVNITTTRK